MTCGSDALENQHSTYLRSTEQTLIDSHYLAQYRPITIYLGHLDKLHHVSTATVTCGSDALETQHSTYLRSTEQDVLFKQAQNSSSKRKRDTSGKVLRPVKVLNAN